MPKKPILNDEALKNITTLALLVGRFDKMQVYDIQMCNHVFLSFEVKDWRRDYSDFKKHLEQLSNHYPIVKQYISSMDQIFEKQDKYRKENKLMTAKDWFEKKNELEKLNLNIS